MIEHEFYKYLFVKKGSLPFSFFLVYYIVHILFYKAKCKQNVKLNDVDMDVVLLSVTLTVSFMAHPMQRTLLCRLALVMYGIKEEIFFPTLAFLFQIAFMAIQISWWGMRMCLVRSYLYVCSHFGQLKLRYFSFLWIFQACLICQILLFTMWVKCMNVWMYMRMSIYSYTFDFDTFKSVIFRYSQKRLFGLCWHFWRKFWFWHFQEWHFRKWHFSLLKVYE